MLAFIQNDPDVPAGNFAKWLLEDQIHFCTVKAFAGEQLPVDDVDALIVLGGAMGVYDGERYPFLLTVKDLIRQIMSREIPVLGVCLGGQMLADILGARVDSSLKGEKGIHSVSLRDSAVFDPLFIDIPEKFSTFQWHNDSFGLPVGADLLASSRVAENQAFRFGRNIYGVQFHPEVDLATVVSWVSSSDGNVDSTEIIDNYIREQGKYTTVSRILLNNFLRLACLID